MSKKAIAKFALGIAVTVAVLYYSLKTLGGLHPRALFHTQINWGLAVVSTVIYMYANYIRALAYTRGLDRNIDRLTAFQIVGIGHAANMVLPLHAGEGLRIIFFPSDYSALRRTKLLLIPGFADFVAIMVLSVLSVPFSGFRNPNLLKGLWILSFLCIAGILLFVGVVLFVPKLRSYVSEYLNIGLAKMMFWVMLSWILLLLSTWLTLVAYGFHTLRSIRMSLAVFATTNIINFIPASPGAIGLFEYGTVLGLSGLGIRRGTALGAALLLHLTQYVSLLPMGAVLYITALHGKYGQTIRNMRTKRQSNIKQK